jgi:hypothetical protein
VVWGILIFAEAPSALVRGGVAYITLSGGAVRPAGSHC